LGLGVGYCMGMVWFVGVLVVSVVRLGYCLVYVWGFCSYSIVY